MAQPETSPPSVRTYQTTDVEEYFSIQRAAIELSLTYVATSFEESLDDGTARTVWNIDLLDTFPA